MSDHERHDELCRYLEAIRGELAIQRVPAEILPLHFNGAKGETERLDAVGLAVSESYGIYNPLAIKAYVALSSTDATEAAGALPIPPKAALILPVRVVEHIKVGVDAGELGVESALIWRLKFAAPQPFFLGAI